MRQKLTWIIPGILVTLLLGLLWAIPAFGAAAGSIAFNDTDGKAITHVSLNGPAADSTGFRLEITDSDLDTITKKVGLKAVIDLAGDVPAQMGEDWHNVQDMNGDGEIDNRDFTGVYITGTGDDRKAYKSGTQLHGNDKGTTTGDNPTADDCVVTFSRSNGTLDLGRSM